MKTQNQKPNPFLEFITSIAGGLLFYVLPISLGLFGAMCLFYWLTYL